jgi:hypothetical protein
VDRPLASFKVVTILRYFTLPIGPRKIKIQKPKGAIFHLLEFLMLFNGLTNTEENSWPSIWLPFGYLSVIEWFQLFGCHTWGPPFDCRVSPSIELGALSLSKGSAKRSGSALDSHHFYIFYKRRARPSRKGQLVFRVIR